MRSTMNLSTRCRYATRAMLEMAKEYGKDPVSLKEIEERQQISRQYLQQLMPPLKKEGLIRVVKGKGGGFFLARKPSDIRIGEIIHAQEGNIAIVECVGTDDLCFHEDQCPTRDIWVEASRRLNDYFNSLTLEKVLKDWEKKEKPQKKKAKSRKRKPS